MIATVRTLATTVTNKSRDSSRNSRDVDSRKYYSNRRTVDSSTRDNWKIREHLTADAEKTSEHHLKK